MSKGRAKKETCKYKLIKTRSSKITDMPVENVMWSIGPHAVLVCVHVEMPA